MRRFGDSTRNITHMYISMQDCGSTLGRPPFRAEIVEAGEQIKRATKQVAPSDTCDSGESMTEIMQLERVTVVAGY
jgi:hypothetical protein